MIRVSFCENAGPKAGVVKAAALCKPSTDELLKVAANKLRLKKAEALRARLFVWNSGFELPRGDSVELCNDTVIAISLGEDYAGSKGGGQGLVSAQPSEAHDSTLLLDAHDCEPPLIRGQDDNGRQYSSLQELWSEQAAQRSAFYAANSTWWADGGYNGSTDEAAMIGDDHSEEDVEESGRFLDNLLKTHGLTVSCALDAGAGVGRVTKQVLLKRCAHVHLVEACEAWSKQSRRYLGKKRALSCTITHARLEEFTPGPNTYDLIWIQVRISSLPAVGVHHCCIPC